MHFGQGMQMEASILPALLVGSGLKHRATSYTGKSGEFSRLY